MYCHQEALLSTYPKETEKEKTLNWGLKNMFKSSTLVLEDVWGPD